MENVVKLNFAKVLRNVVGSELKQYGFKVKDTRLLREKEDMADGIYFQRSQYNVPGHPHTFYLNLYVHPNSFNCFTNIRLNYPTTIAMPQHYKEYLSIPGQDKAHIYEKFSQTQKDEITKWYESTQWTYSNEAELVKVLEVANEILISKGFSYFDTVRNMIANMSDVEEHKKKILQLETELNAIR